MLCLARFCSKASVVEEKPASLHVRRRLLALLAHFFLRLRDQVEAYTATAQFASPLIRITSVLTHTLTTHTALTAHIFRTTESPIAGPARFPELVRLVRLVRTFLHWDQHGERTVVAGWRHLNRQQVTYSASSSSSVVRHTDGRLSRDVTKHPTIAQPRIRVPHTPGFPVGLGGDGRTSCGFP